MADILVVGAGVVGASIAYHAARRGAAVTLVDRGSPASGVTGGSFAWIGGASGDWPGGSEDLRGAILDDFHRFESEVAGVQVRWTGSLSWRDIPVRPGDEGTAPGPDRQVLDASQIATLEPHLREPPQQAIHLPTDGGVDPSRITLALVQAARDHGAEVVLDTPVLSVERVRGRVVGVRCADGRREAATVVLAAGTTVPALCAPLGLDIPVAASPALLLHAQAPSGMVRTVVATQDFEVREVTDGHLVMTAPLGHDTTTPTLERIARRTVDHVASTFDGGDQVRLVGHRLGRRPMPRNGPVIGEHPSVPGLYIAVMHSAICLAPTVGRLVAEELVGQRTVDQLARCRPELSTG